MARLPAVIRLPALAALGAAATAASTVLAFTAVLLAHTVGLIHNSSDTDPSPVALLGLIVGGSALTATTLVTRSGIGCPTWFGSPSDPPAEAPTTTLARSLPTTPGPTTTRP